MTFGDKIKKLRQEKGWNQEYVAQQLNISVPALSRYESGTYEPKSLSIISDFAKLYDVTTDYLLGLSLEYDEEALKDEINIFIDQFINLYNKQADKYGLQRISKNTGQS